MTQDPSSPEDEARAILERGFAAHKAKDFGSAERLYREALLRDPGNSQALLLLGHLVATLGRENESAAILGDLTAREPGNVEALELLAGVLGTLGRHREAVEAASAALRLRPSHIPTLLHLATGYFGAEEFAEAAKTFMEVIRLSPRNISAYYGLATTFMRLGDPMQARAVLRDAGHISPDPGTMLKLGEVCLACDAPEETVAITRSMLAKDSTNLAATLLKATAHRIAQQEAEEELEIQSALRLDPRSAVAHMLLGRRLQVLGKFSEAEDAFRRSIELDRGMGRAYYGIASGRKLGPSDHHLVEQMEDVLAEGKAGEDDRLHLEYALGKAYDNLGEYGQAMAHYDAGNLLTRKLGRWKGQFDRERLQTLVERVERMFTKELLEAPRAKPVGGVRPIIIGGMIRSGTTLMEQILSCHPEIGAAGEKSFWEKAAAECLDYESEKIDHGGLPDIAKRFVALLSQAAPGCEWVTEKTPANRINYGLINLAFPDAPIFDMRRNPVDIALSIYTTMMRTRSTFVGDKADIVFFLKIQERLTAHWREALPSSVLRVVRYEELVSDQERMTREAISSLGLPWSDACLAPEDNGRSVMTPSLWQVRQPVNTGSVERWRRYEPWLGPFAELIEPS